jgi:hypothetical protein
MWFVHNFSSSSSFPVLGLLRPVTGVTKLNSSIFSKVCLNFFSLLVGVRGSDASHTACPTQSSTSPYRDIPCFN